MVPVQLRRSSRLSTLRAKSGQCLKVPMVCKASVSLKVRLGSRCRHLLLGGSKTSSFWSYYQKCPSSHCPVHFQWHCQWQPKAASRTSAPGSESAAICPPTWRGRLRLAVTRDCRSLVHGRVRVRRLVSACSAGPRGRPAPTQSAIRPGQDGCSASESGGPGLAMWAERALKRSSRASRTKVPTGK